MKCPFCKADMDRTSARYRGPRNQLIGEHFDCPECGAGVETEIEYDDEHESTSGDSHGG